MIILIHQPESVKPEMERLDTLPETPAADSLRIEAASDLLDIYLQTDEQSPLMHTLKDVRQLFLSDLDSVATVAEIYGLMYWLMADYGIDNRGESLEETADRLGDIDIENESDQYTHLVFHLKDAVERLYDLELD